eukprot:TRINITY_DN9289_c0_g1_i1.p1 TRINITY_DN9289_c0_g1~~TRINITY_DN9289_c0_g1_i1.p1  ORF type:complete len:726 (+),score=329.10 TRINITY_DN9289_c0_g1_i1:120-2297(+)
MDVIDFSQAVVGIDFGSSVCRVSLADPRKRMPVIVRNNLTNETTPCVVAFDDAGMRFIGENGATKLTSRPKLACNLLPVLLCGGDLSKTLLTVADGTVRMVLPEADAEVSYTAAQLSAMLIGALLSDARSLAKAASDAVPGQLVISLPESADESAAQRAAAAAVVAGVPADRVVVTSAARSAAACYRAMRLAELPAEEADAVTVAVADIGHCHSSAALVKVWRGGVVVLGSAGRATGSRVMDTALADAMLGHVRQKHKEDLSGNAKALARLLKEAQRAKEVLSTNQRHDVRIEALTDVVDLNFPVSRDELEVMAKPLLDAVAELTAECMSKAGVAAGAIAALEMIGGGWRSPFIRAHLHKLWGTDLSVHLDPTQTVAQGAALIGVRRDAAPEPEQKGGDEEEKDGAAAQHADPAAEVADEREQSHRYGMPDASVPAAPTDEAEVARMKEVEQRLREADAARKRLEDARNALESYYLGQKDLARRAGLDKDAAVWAALTEELEVAEMWVYDNDDASVEQYEERLKDLRRAVEKEFPQIKEYEERQQKAAEERDRKLAEERKAAGESKEPKTDGQRIKAAEDRKQQGVVLFKQEHWQEATHRFVQALQFLKEVYDLEQPDIKKRRNEIALSCHLNIATCSIKTKRWQHAAQNCTSALEYDSGSAKALFRRGQAQRSMNNFQSAREDLLRAKELSGGDKAILKEIDALDKQEEQHKKKEKAMYSKMFS